MKIQVIGAALLAAALAACGGKADFVVGGPITGLSNPNLVLVNNGEELKVASGATSFSFPNSISYGTEYNVTIKTQPDHMNCEVVGGKGSAGHTTTISIGIACALKQYTVGGKVVSIAKDNTSGPLSADKLVLVNGSSSGQIAIAKGATSFVIPGFLPYGTAYGLSVFTQAEGQDCKITNGSGVVGDADRTDVVVTCTVL
ncbi:MULTISPECIES: hypothetical protein [unclassified Duganella]|uniref:hypothetical protein n=1 Tax=unclassified Duganella TaxID=2636909 RepID=UPI0006F98095|nr:MULTISPECIES: hypothetical protein [unclassified Duganella]KQV47717.1 hypothetical protein ASD07_12390 [Duganella sp. Root336D2]KRB81995.1 hypothetical protein ASE26_13885 [Duganella sp. Root198D2]